MPSYRCQLCPPSAPLYPKEVNLLDHLTTTHLMDRDRYLDAIQETIIHPDSSSQQEQDSMSLDPQKPSAEERRLLRQYGFMGLSTSDPRLARVCFLQATIKRLETMIRGQVPSEISGDSVKDLSALSKESKSLLDSLIKERDKAKEGSENDDLVMATIREAEDHQRANMGDFQFHCGGCDTWVGTDGLPVWMLFQEIDPKDPSKKVALIGNSEIFYLIRKGEMSLAVAAFILRTSPEALIYTSDYRGDPIVDPNDLDMVLGVSEESLGRLRMIYEEGGGVVRGEVTESASGLTSDSGSSSNSISNEVITKAEIQSVEEVANKVLDEVMGSDYGDQEVDLLPQNEDSGDPYELDPDDFEIDPADSDPEEDPHAT